MGAASVDKEQETRQRLEQYRAAIQVSRGRIGAFDVVLLARPLPDSPRVAATLRDRPELEMIRKERASKPSWVAVAPSAAASRPQATDE